MALHVYRIEVDHWPTDDGRPWARFYGHGAAVPHHEIPTWLAPLVDAALPRIYQYRDLSDLGRIAARIRYDVDRDELVGVLLPKPKRVNYLSASGVSELAADMRAFGAALRVIRSKPVEWEEVLMAAQFEARYPGRCGVCDGGICVDDLVTYVEDEIAHAACPMAVTLADPCGKCWTVPAANGACACEED